MTGILTCRTRGCGRKFRTRSALMRHKRDAHRRPRSAPLKRKLPDTWAAYRNRRWWGVKLTKTEAAMLHRALALQEDRATAGLTPREKRAYGTLTGRVGTLFMSRPPGSRRVLKLSQVEITRVQHAVSAALVDVLTSDHEERGLREVKRRLLRLQKKYASLWWRVHPWHEARKRGYAEIEGYRVGV